MRWREDNGGMPKVVGLVVCLLAVALLVVALVVGQLSRTDGRLGDQVRLAAADAQPVATKGPSRTP